MAERLSYLVLVGVAAALLALAWAPGPPVAPAAPLAQATNTPTPTVTPTPTATPLAAPGWNRTDQPDGDVRCYWATLNGQPYGGCVVVGP